MSTKRLIVTTGVALSFAATMILGVYWRGDTAELAFIVFLTTAIGILIGEVVYNMGRTRILPFVVAVGIIVATLGYAADVEWLYLLATILTVICLIPLMLSGSGEDV